MWQEPEILITNTNQENVYDVPGTLQSSQDTAMYLFYDYIRKVLSLFIKEENEAQKDQITHPESHS